MGDEEAWQLWDALRGLVASPHPQNGDNILGGKTFSPVEAEINVCVCVCALIPLLFRVPRLLLKTWPCCQSQVFISLAP